MDKEKHMVGKIRLVTSAITTYLFLSILTMIIWIALYPPKPATALSFTLTGSSTWAIGRKGAGQTSTSTGSPTTWTVTNDSSPASAEDITIQVTGVTWTSASSAWTTVGTGTNVYVLTLKKPGDTVMGTTATTLASLATVGAQKGFGLAFTTPSASNEEGAHTLTITLTAATYNPCATGGWYSTYCWYFQEAGNTTCDTTCGSHGATAVTGVAIAANLGYNVCAHFYSPVCYPNSCEWGPGGYMCCGSWADDHTMFPRLLGGYKCVYDEYGNSGLSTGACAERRICACSS